MPFTIASFVTRQPALSPVDFQAAYDAHLPFLCSTVGDDAKPSKITRYYVRRAKSDPEGLKPVSYTGSEDSFGYDLVAFLEFRDEEHARVFQEKYDAAKEVIGAKVAEFARLDAFRVLAFQDALVME
jgi:hypothetical protein